MNVTLYRSSTDSMIGGVCGGLGQYLGIDSTFVRLFFLLLALFGNGIGALIYFLLWIIVPLENQGRAVTLGDNVRRSSEEIAQRTVGVGEDLRDMVYQPHPQAGMIVGLALVVVGGVVLIQNLDLPWLQWLDMDIVWPVLLIVGGLALLLRRARGD